jgi:ribosome maturation factor RimP
LFPLFNLGYTVIEQKIVSLLEEKFQEEEYADCFIIEVKHHANNKLEVFIESDSGITFDKCRRISRYLEGYLDTEGWLGEKYVLEVSSPGVGRPLKLHRQYLLNIGRKVEVSLLEGKPKMGKLLAVDDGSITLEEKVRIKEGKKKKTEILQTVIPFDQIKKTVVKISF